MRFSAGLLDGCYPAGALQRVSTFVAIALRSEGHKQSREQRGASPGQRGQPRAVGWERTSSSIRCFENHDGLRRVAHHATRPPAILAPASRTAASWVAGWPDRWLGGALEGVPHHDCGAGERTGATCRDAPVAVPPSSASAAADPLPGQGRALWMGKADREADASGGSDFRLLKYSFWIRSF
jgi:hypothetical protein